MLASIKFFSSLLILTLPLISPALAAYETPCKTPNRAREIRVGPRERFATIQQALDQAKPGDRIFVTKGKYKGDLELKRSGQKSACIELAGEKGTLIEGGSFGIKIEDQQNIVIEGFEMAKISTGSTPTGIMVRGNSSSIVVRGNKIKNISSPTNAHGIAFYGSKSQPMMNILIEGNEVSDCTLGSSEAIALNGNIDGFLVTKNKVHHVDNIGIDVIGHEGTGPKDQDFPRHGVIRQNTLYKITSINNPAYEGELAAGAIYVDGGRDVLIENNTVSTSDIGIEAASEHQGKTVQNVIIRNNKVSGSYLGNIMIGGFDQSKGKAINIQVERNTFADAREAEIIIQHHVNGVQIRENSFKAKADSFFIQATGNNVTNVLVERNRYNRKPSDKSDLANRDGNFSLIHDK